MKLALIHLSAAACPHRLLDDGDHEIAWANDFLDAQHLRQLSPSSLRAYAYDLLHFARWFQSQSQALSEITESTFWTTSAIN
jgi:site-specific recombinase XerD